ncbi:MAG TPA: hypothetical protein ENH99_01380 [Candidatus Pacearchaeota archaeon]|nr:hypothetical protein [Candidatus Pacearchaeota archaeon]
MDLGTGKPPITEVGDSYFLGPQEIERSGSEGRTLALLLEGEEVSPEQISEVSGWNDLREHMPSLGGRISYNTSQKIVRGKKTRSYKLVNKS